MVEMDNRKSGDIDSGSNRCRKEHIDDEAVHRRDCCNRRR